MITQLPQALRDFLSNPPRHRCGENLNGWLFKASLQLLNHYERWEVAETLRIICCDQPTVSQKDINQIVDGAVRRWRPYDKKAQYFPPTQKWPPINQEQIEAVVAYHGGLTDLWERSPIKWEDHNSHTVEIISRLFPGDPFLCVGDSPSKFWTRRLSEIKDVLPRMSHIVPSPMTSINGKTLSGCDSERTKSNTGNRRFLVLEFDHGTLDEQAAVLLSLLKTKTPIVLVLHSGNKSLHAWIYVENRPENALEAFMKQMTPLGADRYGFTKSQMMRMPDGTRDNGNRQKVYYFNPFALPPAEAI